MQDIGAQRRQQRRDAREQHREHVERERGQEQRRVEDVAEADPPVLARVRLRRDRARLRQRAIADRRADAGGRDDRVDPVRVDEVEEQARPGQGPRIAASSCSDEPIRFTRGSSPRSMISGTSDDDAGAWIAGHAALHEQEREVRDRGCVEEARDREAEADQPRPRGGHRRQPAPIEAIRQPTRPGEQEDDRDDLHEPDDRDDPGWSRSRWKSSREPPSR